MYIERWWGHIFRDTYIDRYRYIPIDIWIYGSIWIYRYILRHIDL